MYPDDPWSRSGWGESGQHGGPSPDYDALLGWALTVALCLFVGSWFPREFALAVIADLLLVGGFGYALAALVREEEVWTSTLTGWDQAAGCWLLSMAVRLVAIPAVPA